MQFFNLHTHQTQSHDNICALVNQYPNEFDAAIPHYSIGIHPWYISESRTPDDLQVIESKMDDRNCLAIGECGLDKRIEMPFDLQVSVFEKQLLMAEKYRRPVIIHCVAAFSEVMEIKKRLKISVPMIIHGFSKSEQTAKQLIDHGFYLSFGKYLLKNPDLKSVFKSVPNDRFFMETDTVEESIETVYQLAAKYKNIELQELQMIIKDNFQHVFGDLNSK